MPDYDATDDLDELDASIPLGSEELAILDDVDRETRRVFKAVILKEHNHLGEHEGLSGNALADDSIPAGKLAADSVVTVNILNGNVTADKLAANAVTVTKIADDAIETAKIKDQQVTAAKLTGGSAPGQIFIRKTDGTFQVVSLSGAITLDENGVASIGGSSLAVARYADIKSAAIDGGTFTSGAWQTRDLNSEIVDTATISSLSANEITLAAVGSYLVMASSVANEVGAHILKLVNCTDPTPANWTDIAIGTSENAWFSATRSSVVSVVTTVATNQKIRLQHRCEVTKASDGFGRATNFGVNNTYSELTLIKLS